MPGSRDRNIRSGDLCEGFGLELLRPFALVAPIPRTEDVGAHAVATLTRRDGRRLLAEDSFLVQVKAASVRSLRFNGQSLNCLRQLRLPVFVLRVALDTATLELYSTASASSRPNYADREDITMYLDNTPFDLTGHAMSVGLGPPILRWTPGKAAETEF